MKMLALAILGASIASPAAALEIVDVSVADGNEVTFLHAAPGLLEADLSVGAFAPTVWTLRAETPGEVFAFNASIDVFTGVTLGRGLKTLVIGIEGGSFLDVGAILPAFSTARTRLDGNRLTIRFSGSGEFLNVGLGAIAGGEDFRLAFDPNGADARLMLQALGVPEPASWALMIAGFGLVGSRLRRRDRAVGRAA